MSNKLFYTLIVVGVMSLLGVGVYAYNSGVSPSVMGHSAGEIEEADPTVLASVKDGIAWGEISGIPTLITSETDPTVIASVKDGVSWAEVTGKPAGFADGVDNEGSGVGTLSCTTADFSRGSGYSACSGQTCVFVWGCTRANSAYSYDCACVSCSFTVRNDQLQRGAAICCKVS